MIDVSDIKEAKCEQCGRKAITRVIDIRETDPVKDEKTGNWHFCHEQIGEAHYLCATHDRDPVIQPRFRSPKEAEDWFRQTHGHVLAINRSVRQKAEGVGVTTDGVYKPPQP